MTTMTSQRKRRGYKTEKLEETRASRRICLPIDQKGYEAIIEDREVFRDYLDDCIRRYPELFPQDIGKGYKLNGFSDDSTKLPVRIRRICLHERDEHGAKQVFQVAPCFVMPYMTGYVEDVEKPLFLHEKFGVPPWALSYVFGKDDMYWYRLTQQLGRNNIVGTTIKEPEKLPEHLLADEKHTCFHRGRAYVATTVARECVLGAAMTLSADEAGLKEAYRHFKQEALELDADYQPKTVNTDGWSATQAAWQALFPTITIILCFLHSFLKIRQRAKRLTTLFPELAQKVWEAYRAENHDAFIDKVTVLRLWADHHKNLLSQSAFEAVVKLCQNAYRFSPAYQHPHCYRTSAMLDRHLDALDRYLYSLRYFHGHLMSAERSIRAWALAHNFMPYCPRAKPSKCFISPAHKLNGFVYRENWLENLLVSASLGGRRC
jgi:hypothetical protein